MPHDYIFNRDWYERFDGQGTFDEYLAVFRRLGPGERAELVELLSSCDPHAFVLLGARASTKRLREVLPFYIPVPKNELFRIWRQRKALTRDEPTVSLPEDGQDPRSAAVNCRMNR